MIEQGATSFQCEGDTLMDTGQLTEYDSVSVPHTKNSLTGPFVIQAKSTHVNRTLTIMTSLC